MKLLKALSSEANKKRRRIIKKKKRVSRKKKGKEAMAEEMAVDHHDFELIISNNPIRTTH